MGPEGDVTKDVQGQRGVTLIYITLHIIICGEKLVEMLDDFDHGFLHVYLGVGETTASKGPDTVLICYRCSFVYCEIIYP